MATKGELTAFDIAYNRLNADQKRAVDTIDGPVMVIAGPGTGKTQILTLRIATILQRTDMQPSNILALTFTESGARAMRERLRDFIGHRAYDVGIYTFHGFADMVIRRYPDAFPHIIGARPVTAVEQVRIIEAVLEQGGYTALRPSGDPTYYIKPIQSAIATLKQEYLSPDAFAERVVLQERALLEIPQFHDKGAHKGKERGEYTKARTLLLRNQELLGVYRGYQAALTTDSLYDFSDMISEVVRAFEGNQALLLELQEQYQYVLADEHQDVNGSQNRLLEQLVSFHDHPNIFVVGDEKQAIYRFQGASLDNFLYFESQFGSTTTIALTNNYRSGQPILDAAHALVATDDARLSALRVPLIASHLPSATISLHSFAHEAVEQAWLIAEVRKSLTQIAPNEVAIIVRTNGEVERISALLRHAGIPVSASADSDILEHPIVREALRLLRVVANPSDDEALGEVLLSPYVHMPLSEVGDLFAARQQGATLYALAEARYATGSASPSLERFLKVIENNRTTRVANAVHRQIELLFTEIGFTAHVLATDPYESARVLRRLFDEIESMVRRGEVDTISGVVGQLRLHTTYGLPLTAPYIHTNSMAVQVMTAHKSKGLEFDTVFVPGLTDTRWGKKTNRTLFQLPIVRHDIGDADVVEDDERRLLYVAMTRAKQTLQLSYAEETVEGRGSSASRFVSDIENLLTNVSTTDFEKSFAVLAPVTPAPPVAYSLFMKETLLQRGWSPTALNNYLENPWHYFFSNVLRVPTIKGTELQYGTAVHAVLERAVRTQTWTPTFLSEQLRFALNKEAVTPAESARLHERGLSALVAYSEHLRATASVQDSKTEVSLQAFLPTGRADVPEILLKGNLDRVDFDNGRVSRVVDYKTGKPKSRNVIEGNTKDSNGAYKRQLVFYALLLSLQPESAYHCRVGTLSFVEPTAKGEIKEESFTITDEEIATLKTELLTATNAVLDGLALQVSCDTSVTPYCHIIPFEA